jgi:hypothetical protein
MKTVRMNRTQTRRWRRNRRTGWVGLFLATGLALFFVPATAAAGGLSALTWGFSAAALVLGFLSVLGFTLAAGVEVEAANAAAARASAPGRTRGPAPSQRKPVEVAFPLSPLPVPAEVE